jgi:hypothetical protein
MKEQLLNKLVIAHKLVREVQDELDYHPELLQKHMQVDQYIMALIYDIEDTNSEEFDL